MPRLTKLQESQHLIAPMTVFTYRVKYDVIAVDVAVLAETETIALAKVNAAYATGEKELISITNKILL